MPGITDYEALLRELASPEFPNLRPAQREALQAYVREHSVTRDLAIELPTGAGKSLIALLIGEAWRREGRTVAILTGNKTLARQMEREAESLRIASVRMEGPGSEMPSRSKRAYHRAQAIAIMNYWVYFNQNPVIDPAHLLFMDDAHLAEHCLHSLYSVEINRYAHQSLFETLVTELSTRFPEYSVLQDALDESAPHTTPTELMSFLDQYDVSDRVREIIDASAVLNTDNDLRFRWHRLRGRVNEANLYLSTTGLWLRPYVYPLAINRHYSEVTQRIYMSATVGDTADLARRLGTSPITKMPISDVHGLATQGRRMLVMNRIEDSDLPVRLQTAIIAALRVHPKSVWLCSSRAEATHFQEIVGAWLNDNGFVGHPMWVLSNLGDELDQFKAAPQGHLFVAGRFDGMDFKADECRLVVLATLPRAINTQEEFFTAYLRDSGFMLRRLNQRIIQSLGRCNRAADDYGVYVLADRRFATHFGRESNRQGIPRNIMAEIDCAEDATELTDADLAQCVETFLRGDFTQFDEDLDSSLRVIPATGTASELPANATAADEVVGWREMFDSQDFDSAAQHFENCANSASEQNLRELTGFFRWCQAKAVFLSGKQGSIVAANSALDVLEQAIDCGARSSWFNRLRSSLNRHRARIGVAAGALQPDYAYVVVQVFDELLERLGPRGHRFQRWVEQGTAMLNSESHAEYQRGLERLGNLLGFSASLPRYGASTDCRWRGIFGNRREAITFEAKIEHEAGGRITPSHVGQAHIQLARAKAEYETRGFTVRGTIVTHLVDIDASAESSLGEIRIVRKEGVRQLWDRVVLVLSQYRDEWDLEDVDARMAAAEQVVPRLPPTGWLTDALSKDQTWIEVADLLEQWP